MLTFRAAFVLVLALTCQAAHATMLAGPARVVDGDTLEVGATPIRLFGIDAPEHNQTCQRAGRNWACGTWAGDALRGMVTGREVVCEGGAQDTYGRLVATCRIGGADLNAMLVRQGAAMAYRRYSSRYDPEERAARAERRGIWAGPAQPPEEFRRDAAMRIAALPEPEGGCRIKGNISGNGRDLHRPGQEHYDKTQINASKGERWFCSAAEAEAAGWRAARR